MKSNGNSEEWMRNWIYVSLFSRQNWRWIYRYVVINWSILSDGANGWSDFKYVRFEICYYRRLWLCMTQFPMFRTLIPLYLGLSFVIVYSPQKRCWHRFFSDLDILIIMMNSIISKFWRNDDNLSFFLLFFFFCLPPLIRQVFYFFILFLYPLEYLYFSMHALSSFRLSWLPTPKGMFSR